jgi:glycosyltransferase involved in cell wall biosynthesis
MKVALILWDGNVGGAEKLTVELSGAVRRAGVEASVVFVRDPKHLAPDLDRLGVPYRTWGARRVEEVLVRPRSFVRLVRELGPDGALIPNAGHLAPALRMGGYRAPIIAMEHGFLLLVPHLAKVSRLGRRLERWASVPFVDAEVPVSDFMAEAVRRGPHARRVRRIHNGIALDRFQPAAQRDDGLVVGCATRLVPGKGLDVLLHAFATVVRGVPDARLRIAGDGPERPRLVGLATDLGITGSVELAGVVGDMPGFWRDVDVAVLPSTASESFGMAALEAMATARPVVATRNGGSGEVLLDGQTGTLVEPGDADELATALMRYALDPARRHEHGLAGRRRCEEHFTIEACAGAYAALLDDLMRERRARSAAEWVRTARSHPRVAETAGAGASGPVDNTLEEISGARTSIE